MKKNYLFYGVLAATVTFVTACGSNATTETENQPAAEASTTEASADDTAVNTDNELTEAPEKINIEGLKTTSLLDVDVDSLVKLGDYKGITVEAKKKEVTDQDVEDALVALGYNKKELQKILAKLDSSKDEGELVKDALKLLVK